MSSNKNNHSRNFIQQTLDNYPIIKTILKGLLYSLVPIALFGLVINPAILPLMLTSLSSLLPFKLNILNLASLSFPYLKTYVITLPLIVTTCLLYSAGFFGFMARFLGIKKPLRPQHQETPSEQPSPDAHQCDTNTDNSHMKVKKTCCYLSTLKKEVVNRYLDDMLREYPQGYQPEPLKQQADFFSKPCKFKVPL